MLPKHIHVLLPASCRTPASLLPVALSTSRTTQVLGYVVAMGIHQMPSVPGSLNNLVQPIASSSENIF